MRIPARATLGAIIVSLWMPGCAVEVSSPGHESSVEVKGAGPGLDGRKADQWLPTDDPTAVDQDLEYNLDALPLEGEAEDTPWAGSYWPVYLDSVNHRWAGANTLSPAEKYGAAFGGEDVGDAVSAGYGIDSRPVSAACTDDSACDEDTGEVCSMRPGETEGRCAATWWGLCHAWAPASILEPEPQRSVMRNGVEFTVNDIKALLTLAYDKSFAMGLSLRCNEYNDAGEISYDAYGNPMGQDLPCKDTNAGTFHVVATNFLGLRGESFVEDRTFDAEVWNQPVAAFRTTRLEEVTWQEANALAGVGEEGLVTTLTADSFQGAVDEEAWHHAGSYTVFAGATLTVEMTGSGDPDLYVRTGEVPALDAWDCRPWASGGQESCAIGPLEEETQVFVSVYGYAASEDFTVTARVTKPADAPSVLVLQNTESGQVSKNMWHHLGGVPIQAGATVTATLSGQGDPDLYVRLGAKPHLDAWDCRPWVNGAAEACTIGPVVESTTVYVGIHGYKDAPAFTVDLEVRAPGAHEGYAFNGDAVRFFDVRTELDYVTESPSHLDGNLSDVMSAYIHTDTYTYVLEVDAAGAVIGGEWSGESKQNHPDFLWFPIERNASAPIAGGAITYEVVKSLLEESIAPEADAVATESFHASGGLAKGEWAHHGPFEVGDGLLTASTSGTGDVDLYVRRGAEPTVDLWDCRPYTAGSAETCETQGPGTIYVSVRGYTASAYSLDVNFTTPSASAPDEPAHVPAWEPEHLAEEGYVGHKEMALYTLQVQEGAQLLIRTHAPKDVDLYVRLAAPPTTELYDGRAWTLSGNETYSFTANASGLLHIGVHGYEASSYVLTTE